MMIGFIWLPSAFPDFSFTDPKLISVIIVWVIYFHGIFLKLIAKIYGKKVIIFSLVGFIIAIISLLLSNVFAETFHSFY
jgi:hypothetical protein